MYAFEHEGRTFTPDGETTPTDVSAHNRQVETAEIAWLKTRPDKVFLYVRTCGGSLYEWEITTWLGAVVSSHVEIGEPRAFSCFGPFPSKRRSVRASIFGVRYVGWYFESSGDYCRLRKARS